MVQVKAKPRVSEPAPTDYEGDFYLWCFDQAELLRLRRFSELDLPNLIEELQSMGREQRYQARGKLPAHHLTSAQVAAPARAAVLILEDYAHARAGERQAARSG